MAYDEGVAQRIREVIAADEALAPRVVEKKMFGGIAFMVDGHMTVGVVQDELMVRVGKDAYDDALACPHARMMDFTGREMKGFVFVGTAGFEDDDDLADWIGRGVAHAESLPPK